MYLSELIFNCAKAVADLGDPSLNYQSFMTREALNDPDFAMAVDRASLDINGFFQRLSQLRKVPAKREYHIPEEGKLTLDATPTVVLTVYQYTHNGIDYDTLEYRNSGREIELLGRYRKGAPVYVEYRTELPYFSMDDVPSVTISSDGNFLYGTAKYDTFKQAVSYAHADDTDLSSEWGITNEMCFLAQDWCRAQHGDLDPAPMQILLNNTEQRMMDLNLNENLHYQKVVGREC